MGLGEAELSPHHLWGSSQAWEQRLGFAFGLIQQRNAQGRKPWQLLQGWSVLGSRAKALPQCTEGHRHLQLGPHSFGMSVRARCLRTLVVRGTIPMDVAAGSGLGWEGSGATPGTNKYLWKSALSPWIAEVHPALINADLLTANKHIKWKLLKKTILRK